jgi:glutamyl-tRNA reductase
VVTATASDSYLLTPADLVSLNRELLVFDISVPRNVDPRISEIDGVRLFNIDDLKEFLAPATHGLGETVSDEVGKLISSNTKKTLAWMEEHYAIEPALASFRKNAEEIRRQELQNALSRMPDITPAERAVIEKMSERLLRRLLHGPTVKLRELARDHERSGKAKEYLLAVSELFSMDEEDPEETPPLLEDHSIKTKTKTDS